MPDKNLAIMREEKGVLDLMKAMETHEKEASVIDFACSALWGLSLEGIVPVILSKDCVSYTE